MKIIIPAIILITTFAIGNAQSTFNGLCGAELKQAVKQNHSTKKLLEFPENQLPSLFDINIFTGEKYESPTISFILPPQWWNSNVNINKDLYNIVTGDITSNSLKQSYPPGTVIQPTFSNSQWSVGIGTIDGTKVNFYNPPKGYEGDFARAIFHLLCIYPNQRWLGLGVNFCSDGEYPGLQKWSYRQLKAWNEIDPVDNAEKTRNNKIMEIQGAGNPFIEFPNLAEHIWGDKSEIPYNSATNIPKEKEEPLQYSYRISDNIIRLKSPYISATARWTINGQPIEKETVTPTSLGIGIHEFRFETATTRGKILIEITK